VAKQRKRLFTRAAGMITRSDAHVVRRTRIPRNFIPSLAKAGPPGKFGRSAPGPLGSDSIPELPL